jgi:hypothetical protein
MKEILVSQYVITVIIGGYLTYTQKFLTEEITTMRVDKIKSDLSILKSYGFTVKMDIRKESPGLSEFIYQDSFENTNARSKASEWKAGSNAALICTKVKIILEL